MNLFGLLVVAILLAYGAPCVPLGHAHHEHAVRHAAEPSAMPAAWSAMRLTGVSSPKMTIATEPCHETPPYGVMPGSPNAGSLVQPPPPMADALLAPASTSLVSGIPPLPGEPLIGIGLAGYRTGAAALAVLCILRT